jgi:uncharacterized damage-inducible protein DinB
MNKSSLRQDVHAVLSSTSERWQRLVSTLPADLLARPPAEGEWSALECLRHLLDTERQNFPVRVRTFLAGEDFVNFDPNQPHDDTDAQTPEQLVAAFTLARQKSLILIRELLDDDLSRTAQHPRFGTVTLEQMLHTWAAHDLNHTIQAERALMQPFMLGCGPWRTFFTDHEIAAPKQ